MNCRVRNVAVHFYVKALLTVVYFKHILCINVTANIMETVVVEVDSFANVIKRQFDAFFVTERFRSIIDVMAFTTADGGRGDAE